MQEVFRTFAAVVNSQEIDPSVREAFVFAAWKRTAGELLCEHAVPISLDGSVLFVAVSSPAWKKHLADLSRQMLLRLNDALGGGTVKRIEFVIDETRVSGERVNAPRYEIDDHLVEMEISGEVSKAAESIEDVDLRDAFLSAAGRCLVRRNARIAKGAN